jgi:hypothetical protein
VLSIQYVYERVILFLYPPLIRLAGAKVQLFFNLASFFEKKILTIFSKPLCQYFLRTYTPPILSFRVGKDTTFTFYYPNLFLTFF